MFSYMYNISLVVSSLDTQDYSHECPLYLNIDLQIVINLIFRKIKNETYLGITPTKFATNWSQPEPLRPRKR